MAEDIIQITDAYKVYPHAKIKDGSADLVALNKISLSIRKGETLGLVGESGSGKTTLGKAILGLETLDGGSIRVFGQDLADKKSSFSQKLQLIFQDPYSALNPHLSALDLVKEPLRGLSKAQAEERALEILALVGIEGEDVHKLPKAFSGGQRQRIGIARAVVGRPEFIVCDEPTSALDVSIQSQIIHLLQDLQKELGLSYLFISHDLSVVRHVSDRIAVLYHGHLLELAPAEHLFSHPQHPYTRYLLEAKPELDPKKARKKLAEGRSAIQTFEISPDDDWYQYGPEHFVRSSRGGISD